MLLLGALFGFCAYATYDITNLATLRGWPTSVAVIDLAWGTAATAIAALASFWLTRALSDRRMPDPQAASAYSG